MQNILIPLFLVLGIVLLSTFNASLSSYKKIKKGRQKKIIPPLIYGDKSIEDLLFLIKTSKNLLYIAYITYLYHLSPIHLLISIIVVALLDLISFFIGAIFFKRAIKISSILSTIYFLPLLFISLPLLKITKYISKKHKKTLSKEEELIGLIYDIDVDKIVDHQILKSLLTFKEKVTREVMIPRIKVFSLPYSMTIRDACKKILERGYSRIPIYKDKIDNIIGILMYKDILNIYVKNETFEEINKMIDKPIETLKKPIIYVPENKKISKLFQEFRAKQKHLAIVVNEYGAMEGIITIEDILEELVGEIEDEYDINEEREFFSLPSGSIVADAKMSIIDVEKALNISLPHSPEYETIGGLIFHLTGTIPKKGWSLHLDQFDIEILSSTDRCINKVKITPIEKKEKPIK